MNVLKAHYRLVYKVLAFVRTVISSCNGDLVVVKSEAAVGIVNYKRDLRKSVRTAVGCSAENDILHGLTAEIFGRLLTEHPPDGIGYVAFAAAVRSDDGGNALAEPQHCFVGKGFKALYFYRL